MPGIEVIRIALGALASGKARSALAMLSVIIGVGSVVATMALGEGAQKKLRDRLGELDLRQWEIQQTWIRGGGRYGYRVVGPDWNDYLALKEELTTAEWILPEIYSDFKWEYREHEESFPSVGVPTFYHDLFGYRTAHGRFFDDLDGELRRRVVVLCDEPAGKMAGPNADRESLIGKNLTMNGHAYEVIGVLAPGGMQAGRNLDDDVLLPLETMRHRIMGPSTNRWQETRLNVRVRSISMDHVMDTGDEIVRILRRSQQTLPEEQNQFRLYYKPFGTQLGQEVDRTFAMLVTSVAAISLIVGGVGVMNIMLVSVTERTQEIGVRKALGATRMKILGQFLAEAIVLCALGGFVGLAAGWGATKYLTAHYDWVMIVTPLSLVLSVGCSVVVAIASGLYPAMRAAFRDPVEALRYE